MDKVKEEATAAGGRRGTFVQTPANRAAAQTFAVAVAVDAGVVERRRERASGRLWYWLSTVRKLSRCAGGRRFDKVKEEATATGGRRGTFVEMPATHAAAPPFAAALIEEKSPGRCQGFSFGTARTPYFFFGMYRSVIVPS